MKILACSVADYEKEAFAHYEKEFGLNITYTSEELNPANKHIAKGYDAITFLGHSVLDKEVLTQLKEDGVQVLAARTIGYNNIDIDYAKSLGFHVSNARYDPYNVADFTVMLMLMMVRKAKISICRALVNDFSLDSMQGREMRNMCIGIIGTGRIGTLTIQNLYGFGCRILAHDKVENETVKRMAEYVDLDTIYQECDIISLHMPLTDDNYHIINQDSIRKMKDGVILINTARGALIDSEDLIAALESGKVGGAGMDSVEGEEGIAHVCVGTKIVDKRTLLYLKQFPNVILTQHYGFFTKEACNDMVKCALLSILAEAEGKDNPYRVI